MNGARESIFSKRVRGEYLLTWQDVKKATSALKRLRNLQSEFDVYADTCSDRAGVRFLVEAALREAAGCPLWNVGEEYREPVINRAIELVNSVEV